MATRVTWIFLVLIIQIVYKLTESSEVFNPTEGSQNDDTPSNSTNTVNLLTAIQSQGTDLAEAEAEASEAEADTTVSPTTGASSDRSDTPTSATPASTTATLTTLLSPLMTTAPPPAPTNPSPAPTTPTVQSDTEPPLITTESAPTNILTTEPSQDLW